MPEVVTSPTLLFRVGDTVYGCHIGDAREIISLRRLTRLPGAPPFVRGLLNMRGTIVTVLDLGMRLDPARAPIVEGSVLLVRHRERLVGVVVDEVVDVRPLELDAGDAPEAGGIVRAVATLGDGAVIILDLETLITQVLLA